MCVDPSTLSVIQAASAIETVTDSQPAAKALQTLNKICYKKVRVNIDSWETYQMQPEETNHTPVQTQTAER